MSQIDTSKQYKTILEYIQEENYNKSNAYVDLIAIESNVLNTINRVSEFEGKKKIEPFIAPIGFDWKIGISLITSFAAREVFVGTMATIYSSGDSDNTETLREKLASEKNVVTQAPVYTTAVCWSLLVFYAFAMQCMSTLATTYSETKHWKWPFIQLVFMSVLAYGSSFIVFNVLK